MGYRCDVVGGVEIKRRIVKDISKLCLGPGRAGPSSPSDCPSNHTPCAQGHWPLAVPFISQSARTCCSLPPPPPTGFIRPLTAFAFRLKCPLFKQIFRGPDLKKSLLPLASLRLAGSPQTHPCLYFHLCISCVYFPRVRAP